MLQRACSIRSSSSKVLQAQCTSERFQLQNSLDTMSYHPLHSTSQQATHSKRTRKKEHQQPECIKGVPTFLKFNSCATSGHQQPRTKSQYGRLNFQNVQPIPASGSNSNQHTEKELIYPLVVGHWKQVFGQHPHFSLSLSLSLHFSILIFLH